MLKSKIFTKAMLGISGIIAIYTLALSIVIIPKINKSVQSLEEKTAKESLEKIVTIVKNFSTDLDRFKNYAIKSHKMALIDLTNTAWSIIQAKYEQSKMENIGNILKKRGDTFKKNLIDFYNKNKERMARKKLENAIKNYIRLYRYNEDGTGYFFALDFQSNNIVHPTHPEQEGKNYRNLKDSNGVYFVNRMAETARNNGTGFVSYKWENPATGKEEDKISYIFTFEPFNWIIGTGEYYSVLNRRLKNEVISLISKLRYRRNGYFFITDYNNIIISHPYLQGRDFSDVRDVKGNLIVPPMVKIAREQGEGFYQYWWLKDKGDKKAYPKLTFVKDFPNWKMIIGTGIYLDDIEKELKQKKDELMTQLRHIIFNTKIGNSGYLYIFDDKANVLIHPNSNLDGKNIAKLLVPGTRKFIFNELVNVARSSNPVYRYKFDKPSDPGHYVYQKISWIHYVPEFKWYICASVYQDDIQSTSLSIRNFIIGISLIVLLISLCYAFIFMKNLLEPVTRLSVLAQKITGGDYNVRCPVKRNDEMGQLARNFNTMVDTIKASRERLEEQVRERTKELLNKTKELADTNRQLMKLDQAKSAFLSSVSHELRTPLTSILGFSKLIQKDFQKFFAPFGGNDKKLGRKAERILGNVQIIVKEGERLTRLINDVLDLAKIESGKISWNDTVFPLTELLKDAAASVSGQFTQKKDVDFITKIPEDLPEIHADRDRLQQVFVNLLNNAAKFTDKGRVIFSAKVEDDGSVLIMVQDTGVGIPKNELEKVFDKFHQVVHKDTLEDKPEGTGLGLPICKQIIDHYKGKIWVESEQGKGSTFYIRLPVSRHKDSAPSTDSQRDEMESAGDRPIILVVDDDSGVRAMLSQIFENEGFAVITAGSGEEAIAMVTQRRPELITMDILMPGMDGMAAIEHLKQDPQLSDIPILVISALSKTKHAVGDAFLEKPIDEKLLLTVVHSLLNKKQVQKKTCIVVTDHHDAALQDVAKLPVSCSEDVILCSADEVFKQVQAGFHGCILIPSGLVQKMDIETLTQAPNIHVIII